jgi:TM2 domain-containing membrane protein YozV
MRKSEEYEMALAAEQALQKASLKYEELIEELKKADEFQPSNLSVTIQDSLRNLDRKVEAYLHERIPMDKVLDEFVFEYEVLSGELEIGSEEPVRIKKMAKRLISSYEDFIAKVGGRRKLGIIKRMDNPGYEKKSKAKAYLFWFLSFFGVLGFHRFYLGKIGTGFGWLLTGGVLGFGAIYDLFALSKMVDDQNMYNELRAAKLKQLSSGE